ncbi:MAG: virulence RhuM family protein [Gammaproteobacteria bacterium]|nr:virulence RhuM family protein [Gammaproteobacteria bacterium]
MTDKNNQKQKGEIVIYKSPDGSEIQVRLNEESVWLDAHLIAKIFGVQRPAVVKHIHNIYKTSELDEKLTCSILEQVAKDEKNRKMNLYNLDVIISVGYRVNSQKATQFRIWATKILKQYLVKGYAVNEERLLEAGNRLNELQEAILFLQKQSQKALLKRQEIEILNLLGDYSKTLSLLETLC